MSYQAGLKLGVPIALGYFAVSMAYGLSAVVLGFRPLEAALISITNLTSAGQFAGTSLIVVAAPLSELILTTLVINARYFLMALSLSQKLEKTSLWQRLLMAYGITDEIFAAAIGQSGQLSFAFMMGLITLPVAGWTAGTYAGSRQQPAVCRSGGGLQRGHVWHVHRHSGAQSSSGSQCSFVHGHRLHPQSVRLVAAAFLRLVRDSGHRAECRIHGLDASGNRFRHRPGRRAPWPGVMCCRGS